LPIYSFINNETGEEFTESMSMHDLDAYLSTHPNISQIFSKVTISRGGEPKPPQVFRDLVNNIKKKNKHNTIETTW